MRIEEFEKLAPDLRQQMLRIGQDFFGNQQDAEDVAQEGLIRLWTYCERLDASFTLSPLAIKVAKNICIALYKSRRAETAELQTDIPAQPSYNADARLATQENLHRIESALDTLPPHEAKLFRKRHFEEKTNDEIVQETGLPLTSVKSILSRAKAKLKKRLLS